MGKVLAVCAAVLAVTGAVQAQPAIRLTSADFRNGAPIPAVHEGNTFGCTGRNVPPTLRWSAAPSRTRSFALTMVDPDAPKPGGFVHWIVYNIPASRRTLGPGSLHGTQQGENDAGVARYVGPCPPPDSGTHHYHFTLYALNVRRLAARRLTLTGLQQAMRGHGLARATLIGTFERQASERLFSLQSCRVRVLEKVANRSGLDRS